MSVFTESLSGQDGANSSSRLNLRFSQSAKDLISHVLFEATGGNVDYAAHQNCSGQKNQQWMCADRQSEIDDPRKDRGRQNKRAGTMIEKA